MFIRFGEVIRSRNNGSDVITAKFWFEFDNDENSADVITVAARVNYNAETTLQEYDDLLFQKAKDRLREILAHIESHSRVSALRVFEAPSLLGSPPEGPDE